MMHDRDDKQQKNIIYFIFYYSDHISRAHDMKYCRV